MAAIGGTIAAAAVQRRRRQLKRRFMDKGAINPEHAVTLPDIGESHTWLFDRLVRAGVFVAVADGRYYMDEQAERQHRHRTRVRALLIFGVVMLVCLIVFLH